MLCAARASSGMRPVCARPCQRDRAIRQRLLRALSRIPRLMNIIRFRLQTAATSIQIGERLFKKFSSPSAERGGKQIIANNTTEEVAMKKIALLLMLGTAVVLGSASANAAEGNILKLTNDHATDFSSHGRHWRRHGIHRHWRHGYYRPHYRRYGYVAAPYYDSYAYSPAPYYYGGPVISFGFGGGGFRGGGWGHHHRHW